jgi:alcohol dehydrogenase
MALHAMTDWKREIDKERWRIRIGPARVGFGAGRLAELGRSMAGLGIERPLLVTDPGIVASGHAATARAALEAADLEVEVFSEVGENPTDRQVARGAERAAAHRADGLVAVGGGSPMDCAKGINFVHTNGGAMPDYRGYGRATKPLLPSVGVPTTAGTGSEAQTYALISRNETHEKMACGDPGAGFREVILDPELSRTAPRPVIATSGLDAISHAVESFVTKRRNPLSSDYARAAWRRLDGAIESVLSPAPTNTAWAEMLVGSHLAGAAIEQSMLGAAHAAANPLTARHGLVHGAAVMLMLPAVVRYNGAECSELYGELTGEDGSQAAERLARRLERLRELAALPATLRQVGVAREELPKLARLAAIQWTAAFNPRPLGAAELRSLYESVY